MKATISVLGCAEKSYGIQVARLAGLPENVIDRSKEVLHQLESGQQPAGSVKVRWPSRR